MSRDNLNQIGRHFFVGIDLKFKTKKISENMSSELGSISSGMGLPPGMKLPF